MKEQRSNYHYFLNALVWILTSTFTWTVYGTTNQKLKEIDSVLDRLERKLIEEDRRQLFIDQKTAPGEKSILSKPEPVTIYNYEPTKIEPNLPKQEDLEDISQTITKLEDEMESLGGEVESLKQRIFNETRIDAYIELSAMIPNPDQVSLREFVIKMDGFLVFELQRSGGLWLPRSKIPLFSGPLHPGDHEIEIQARVVRKHSEELPVDSNLYHIYQQKFKLEVPSGRFQKGYRIVLSEVVEQNLKAEAKLEPYEI